MRICLTRECRIKHKSKKYGNLPVRELPTTSTQSYPHPNSNNKRITIVKQRYQQHNSNKNVN